MQRQYAPDAARAGNDHARVLPASARSRLAGAHRSPQQAQRSARAAAADGSHQAVYAGHDFSSIAVHPGRERPEACGSDPDGQPPACVGEEDCACRAEVGEDCACRGETGEDDCTCRGETGEEDCPCRAGLGDGVRRSCDLDPEGDEAAEPAGSSSAARRRVVEAPSVPSASQPGRPDDARATGSQRPPHQGSATIVCDGSGGYRADLRGWAGAPCGIEGCVRRHEESHAADWRGRWPNGCKNADGTPKADGSSIPLGGDGYAAFLRASECTAYTVEENCIAPLVASASDACKPRLRSHLADTRAQKNSYC